MFVRKLAISNFLARKARVALTVAAIALSVSLVVAVTSGYASVREAVRKFMDQWMGAIDAQITRQNDPRGAIPERVVAELRADPDVSRADGRVEVESVVHDASGKYVEGRNAQVFGVDPAAFKGGDPRINNLALEAGQFFKTADGDVAVVDQAMADKLLAERTGDPDPNKPPPEPKPEDPNKPKRPTRDVVGTNLTLPGDRPITLKVIGVVHKPDIIAQQIQTVYVPLRALQRFQGWDGSDPAVPTPQINRVAVELAKGADPRAWERKWQQKLPTIDPNLKVKLTRDTRAELDKQLEIVDLLSYLGGTVSMLAATFIVFTSLSMGVSERQRSLAMLRAVGAYRTQIALLVVAEGVLLSAGGVLVGVPMGWVWVKLLSLRFPDVFSIGVVVSWPGVAFGSIGSMLAALAASALPAWWATRVDPLEAMAPESAPPSSATPYRAAVAGILLAAIDPFLFFGPLQTIVGWFHPADLETTTRHVQIGLHFLLGLPGIMIGFFLLAPLFVKAAEAALGPVVAAMFGLNIALFRQQVSSGLWRAAGTCAALMVGLATLVVMQVQGHSALQGWKLPTHFPDIFIVSPPGVMTKTGLEIERQKQMESIPGIRNGEVTPIAIASPEFGHGLYAQFQAAVNPTATMFFGIDPEKALDMMQLEFRAGTAEQAKLYWRKGKALWLKPDQTVLAADNFTTNKDGQKVSKTKGVNVYEDGTVVMQGLVSQQADGGFNIELVGGGGTMSVPASQLGRAPGGGFRHVTLKDGRTLFGSVTPAWEPGKEPPATPPATQPAATQPATQPTTGPAAPKKGRLFGGLTDTFSLPGGIFGTKPATPAAPPQPPFDGYSIGGLDGAATWVPMTQVASIDESGLRITDGRFLVVTNEFKELKGLGVGDDFTLKTSGRPDLPIAHYTITGVVWSPGIDVIVSVYDMGRQFDQRTAASVFGTVKDAKEDFGLERIYLWAANLDWGLQKEDLLKTVKERLKMEGLRAGDVRQIKTKITEAFNRLLLLASSVAFAAMAVASLGVTNTVMAGIRTRRWQFGVLRSIGVTRGQLLRLVMSEATLLGIIACALGLSAGGLMARDAHELSRITTGYNPPIAVPWDMIGIGAGIVLFISLAASLWPAVTVARTEPLSLLQAGRAAT